MRLTVLEFVIDALKFIFPAYCANAVPVILGGGLPIDFGKKLFDDKPIFGENKTFRGFFVGLIAGTGVGLIESMIFGYPIGFGVLLSLGALVGDLTGSFIKRRLGLSPGGVLPVVDQVDFVLGAIVFSLPVYSESLSWNLVLTVLILTPPIHLLTNFGAYKLGLKSNPW